MSHGGVLVVMPPASGISPASMVAGLPLIRRIVLAALTAGYARVLVRDTPPGLRDLLAGTEASILSAPNGMPAVAGGRIVLLPSNVVPQSRWLRELREMPIDGETLYVDASLTAVVETDRPGPVMEAALRSASAGAAISELRSQLKEVSRPLDPPGRRPLGTAADVPGAERWLLHSLIKQSEGFMSRHFERRISLAITRRLAATSVTPNAMTLVSLGVGLLGAPFFLSASAGAQLTGALLFLLHSILDGCDGELARLKFLQSRTGAVLDYWGDNVVHVAVFGCLAIGWSLSLGAAWPLILGAVVAATMLGSAAMMFQRIVDDQVRTASDSAADRLAGAVANRDFIYLVILAAAFGKARWCLVAATAGAPSFLALMLWRAWRRGRLR